MNFNLSRAIEILEKTPTVLRELLSNLSDEWIFNNEGGESWSPFDIVGHLIHGEKTDWIVRAQIILSEDENKTFFPFDRFAQFESSKGKSLDDLLEMFGKLRTQNLAILKKLSINEKTLENQGIHPDLGNVSLSQLLSTWVVHDLGHISQITRVMARQYKTEVGPWSAYLSVLS